MTIYISFPMTENLIVSYMRISSSTCIPEAKNILQLFKILIYSAGPLSPNYLSLFPKVFPWTGLASDSDPRCFWLD